MSYFIEKVKAKFVKLGKYWRVIYLYSPTHKVLVQQRFNSAAEALEYIQPSLNLDTTNISGIIPVATYCRNDDIGAYLR